MNATPRREQCAARIETRGANWSTPAAATTAWQRERWSTWSKVRANYAVAGEHWAKSLFGWVMIGSVVAALWGMFA